MEYVILIIVIAVLALGVGGWLLFVRPRRGRGVSAPPAPPTTPSAPSGQRAPAETAESGEAGKPQATAGVIEVERPPPSAGRMVRLRARLARSQSSVGSALLNLLSRDRLDDETWDEMEEVLITADGGGRSISMIPAVACGFPASPVSVVSAGAPWPPGADGVAGGAGADGAEMPRPRRGRTNSSHPPATRARTAMTTIRITYSIRLTVSQIG